MAMDILRTTEIENLLPPLQSVALVGTRNGSKGPLGRIDLMAHHTMV